MIKSPAKSTVHAVLDRIGLVKPRKRRRLKARGTEIKHMKAPNQLWCADYKGDFRLGNKQYCYPLTITDYSFRCLIACGGLAPETIRTDNGVPFASPNAFFGLSPLSVWWRRLGIQTSAALG